MFNKKHSKMGRVPKKNINDIFSKKISFFVQSFGTLFFRIIFYLIFNIKISGDNNFKKINGPLIIVSNHIAPYDSFLFHIFFRPFSPILPLRFMGAKFFFSKPLTFIYMIGIIPLIYKLFGVFTITQNEGVDSALTSAKRIIQQNGTVAIFPEGRMCPDNQIGLFKWGAAVLAQSTSATVICVSIKKIKGSFLRDKIILNIGHSFNIDKHISAESATCLLREQVVMLHSKNN